jgi:hypothetical protein
MANMMLQWAITSVLSLLHPFFVSVIEINHNAKESTVEISVRIFTEDLEKTINKSSTIKYDMVNPTDNAQLDKAIANYLNQKLKLKINGQTVIMNMVGHEIQKESVWSYLEIPKIPDMKKLELDCTILYDFEKSQSNIFHVKSRNNEKSFKLDNPNSKTSFDF